MDSAHPSALSRQVAAQHQPVHTREGIDAKQLSGWASSVIDRELRALVPQAHRSSDDHVEALRVKERAVVQVKMNQPAAVGDPLEREFQFPAAPLIDLPDHGDAGVTGELKLREAESVGDGTQLGLPSLGLSVSQYSARPEDRQRPLCTDFLPLTCRSVSGYARPRTKCPGGAGTPRGRVGPSSLWIATGT
jgi:hypothetical protein